VSVQFTESHIRQILQSIDIVEVISSYVSLRQKGREFLGLCPFHNDHKPSMHVVPAKQIFKCFSCGAGGDVIKFIMLRERMTFPEVVVMLAERVGVKLPQRSERAAAVDIDRNELEKINRWAARYFRKQYDDKDIGEPARDYVGRRSIDELVSRQFGLGWAPDSWDNLYRAAQADGVLTAGLVNVGLLIEKDQGGFYDRFRQRLMFPVLDGLGRVTGFGGRTLGDDPAKYLNSPESGIFDKSRALYGLHRAKDSIIKQRTAIVVEGYTDCIMAHQHDVTNVVATLGTALTRENAGTLRRYAERIVLVFDSDEAGKKAADRAIDQFFSQQVDVFIVTLPEGKDPCDFLLSHGKKAFMELVNTATEALEYKWRLLQSQLNASDGLRGQKEAVESFLSMVGQKVSLGGMDKISEGFLLNRVAKLVDRPVSVVHETVGRLRRRQRQSNRQNNGSAGNMDHVDSLVRSQQEILEVLLNKQELFSKVKAVLPDVSDFSDPELKQIAGRIWGCYQDGVGMTLAEILAGCQSPELCRKMTDLADRGADRGNYEQTLSDALENIKQMKEKQTCQELRQMVSSAGRDFGQDAETAMLYDLQTRIKRLQAKPDSRKAGGWR